MTYTVYEITAYSTVEPMCFPEADFYTEEEAWEYVKALIKRDKEEGYNDCYYMINKVDKDFIYPPDEI
jgi:hypothetical protein